MTTLRERTSALTRRVRAAHDLGASAAVSSEDALSLQRLAPLGGRTLPWTTFTMRPTAIAAVATDILVGRRRNVLECGSGNSTVFMARLFRELGAGAVTSLDHDPDWANMTRQALDAESLTRATVLHRDLTPAGWYDLGADDLAGPYDVLVVDGPPGNTSDLGMARYPALPSLMPHLAADATVFLDDVNRVGEQRVIERWSAEFGIEFERVAGGIAVGRRA